MSRGNCPCRTCRTRIPREESGVSARLSRGCYEDAARKLLSWNLSFRPHRTHCTHRCGLLTQILHHSSCVCVVSVCRHNGEPCKNGRTDRDAVWSVDSCGPMNRMYRCSPDPQVKGLEGALMRYDVGISPTSITISRPLTHASVSH